MNKKFWRWYLGVLSLRGISLKWIFSPQNEFAAGLTITVVGMVTAAFTSLWLLLLIPVGITVGAHGYWRESEK